MKFKIKIKDKLEFFIKIITILSLIDPIKKLRPKERLLLSYFLYYNDKYKELSVEDRCKILSSKETRIDICKGMVIDSQTYYNNKSQLKSKSILDNEYLTKGFVEMYYKDDFDITFKFDGKR